MDINFPTKQFEYGLPKPFIAGWKRTFLREVTRILILHDRTNIALADPTRKNIVRAITKGISVGANINGTYRIDKSIVHPKKFPKDFEQLLIDETNRIMDEEELANKETTVV